MKKHYIASAVFSILLLITLLSSITAQAHLTLTTQQTNQVGNVTLSSSTALGASDSQEWNKTYGGADDDCAYSVIQTDDGGYVIAGSTGSYDNADVWLFKVDSLGNQQWNKTYAGPIRDEAFDMVQTRDGGFALAGLTDSCVTSTGLYGAGSHDFLLIKTDSSGNQLWNKTYGSTSGDIANSLIETNDGGFALAGFTNSVGACWLVRTDSLGNALWNKTYGESGFSEAYSVIQMDDGGFVLGGLTSDAVHGGYAFLIVRTDSAGNQLWSKTCSGGYSYAEAWSMVKTNDGGFALLGMTRTPHSDSYDYYFLLVKTDSEGNQLWSKTFGNAYEIPQCVIQTSDGGFVLAGSIFSIADGQEYGSQDFWLIKTDSEGNQLWDKIFGGPDKDQANCVIQTSDGEYVIAGYTTVSVLNKDAWLIKTFDSVSSPTSPSPLFSPTATSVPTESPTSDLHNQSNDSPVFTIAVLGVAVAAITISAVVLLTKGRKP